MVGFYHCTAMRVDDSATVQADIERHGTGPAVLGSVTRSAVSSLAIPDDCVFTHARPLSDAEKRAALAREPKPSASATALMEQADRAEVRAQALFPGGRIEIASAPEVTREHVILRVHSRRALDTKWCRPWIFLDGNRLTWNALRYRTPHEVELVMPRDELRGIGQSRRFVGNLCGVRFALGERNALGRFELRARLDGAPHLTQR